MQTSAHGRDSLQAAYAFARRTTTAVNDWLMREARTAPPAALALARITLGCAASLRDEAAREFERVIAGGTSDIATVSSITYRISVLERFFETFEQSVHRSLHPVLSPTVKSLLRELDVAEGQVLVSGTRELTYELQFLRRTDFAALIDDTELDSVEWPFLIFHVPRPPMDWPIHYCMLFHEVGHAVFKTRALENVFKPTQPDSLRGTPEEIGIDEYLKRFALWEKYKKSAIRWIEELFADFFALLSVGPAYLHSFCRVLGATTQLTDCSFTHPPTALRIAAMYAVGSLRHFLDDIPSAAKASLGAWNADAQAFDVNACAAQGSEADFVSMFTVDLCNGSLAAAKDIVQSVQEVLGDHLYTPKEGQADLDRAKLICEFKIPAIEHDELPSLDKGAGRPLRAARIFASNWAAYYLHENLAEADRYDQMREQGEHVLNSLDGAEAIRAWTNAHE